MGQQFEWFIQITDMNSGQKFKERLRGPIVNYDLILALIQSFSPQVDLQTITIYYWKYNSWRMFLKSSLQDLAQNHVEFETHLNQVLLQIRYHCEYFLQNQQEDLIKQDLYSMNQKVAGLQKMYQELREKYIQQTIDINVYWGSPLFADDSIVRNKKGVTTYSHLNQVEYQVLANQVKYTPYVNAVTQAINTCSNKKVQLFLSPLNHDSFKKKNVFTISYIIAHVEILQQEKKEHFIKKTQFSKSISSKLQKSTSNPRLSVKSLKSRQKEQKTRAIEIPDALQSLKLQKQTSYKGEQIQMVIQESTFKKQLKIQSSPELPQNSVLEKMSHTKSQSSKLQLKQSIIDIDLPPQEICQQNEENSEDQALLKSYTINQPKQKEVSVKKSKSLNNKSRNRRKLAQPTVYMLGERLDGGLCKIYPEQFKRMFDTINKPMDLLILHTSYPHSHLSKIKDFTQIKQLEQLKSKKQCAKNIILINSNPVHPEPSTIYFIKQFFIHLLKTGKIGQSYQKALQDLNTLKGVSQQLRGSKLQSKTRTNNNSFYDQKEVQFIHKISQKWVHGSMECCCCYHPHYEDCKSKENNRPTKYAQYHYRFHTIHCECLRDYLMIHNCDHKKQLMRHLQVLDKHSDFNEFYFCCCTGYELGYYRKKKYNQQKDYTPFCTLNDQRDWHSLKYKYKYEKRMADEQKFQFEIFDGHTKGNIGKNLMDAFNYLDKNSLIGNDTVIIDLLEIFTKSNEQEYNICNIVGSARTGRKTIAKYFASLIIVKQVFKKFVIKNINTSDSLANIIRKEDENHQSNTLFIFIFNQKYFNDPLNVSKQTFGRPVSAIIISQEKIKQVDSLKVKFIEPKAFKHKDCLSYVKMYKHLKPYGKRNLQTLFTLAKKGFDNSNNYKLYPCELNQFQILNLVSKTIFTEYQIFQPALERINPSYVHYYLFLMSIIKFTTTPLNKFDVSREQKQENLNEFQRQLIKMQQQNKLFFKDYNGFRQQEILDSSSSFKESEASYVRQRQPQYDVKQFKNEIINFERIRQHYYLIYACVGYRLKPHLLSLLKMFINYSTVITTEDARSRRPINHLRIKNTPFADQVYEATTINNNSYISRYFKDQLKSVHQQFALFQQNAGHTEQLLELQEFLKLHCRQLDKHQRLVTRKSINESYSKPKEKEKKIIDQYCSYHNQSVDFQKNPTSEHYEKQASDIPNIYHLAAVVQAGLQFIRSIISNHFIYSRMNEASKIDFLMFSILLVNNCVILQKNKSFVKIKDKFDLDSNGFSDLSATNITNKIYESSHRYSTPISPNLQTIKSHDPQSNLPSVNRTYSGKQILNTQREFSVLETSAAKSTRSQLEQEQHANKPDEFLLRQLYRLSTYKGLLYLLSEMQRRCDEISDSKKLSQSLDQQKIARMRIAIQLLGIQVRLQQLHIQPQQTRIPQNCQDRHLARLYQVFTQKNYNIIALKRILREYISKQKSFPNNKQQLGIIKSHMIVALALMSSCYGKFKLVRGNFMIQQIDQFLKNWDYEVPLYKRESQVDKEGMQYNEPVTKMHKTHSIFAFMRLISQNQSVYLYIIQSFNSAKFWPEQKKKNDEIQVFTKLLRLFHLFTLKNTKSKKDFYKKLQYIQFKVNQEFKTNKHSNSFSTYIHHFKNSFLSTLKKQMNKLASNLILILTAQSDAAQHDIKMSISQKMQELLQRKSKETQYFCLKKQLNKINLQRLCNGYRCNYLYIYTSPLKDDQKNICIQTNEKKGYCPTEELVDLLKKAVYKVLFVCLPKKKSLAQSLVDCNKIKRIVYFDFSYNNFIYSEQKFKDELLIFQKMIMVTIVTRIMRTIIEKESHNSTNAIPESISYISSALQFILVDDKNRELIRIKNAQIRKCLFMDGDIFQNTQNSEIIIKLHQKDRIKAAHLAVIQKFTKRSEEKLNDKKGFWIELPAHKQQFLDVLSFYFREKLSFHQIFRIDLQQLKIPVQPRKGPNNNTSTLPLKSFYQKLTADKILEHIFSNKKVILTLQFKQYDRTVEECERVVQEVMTGFEQDYYSNRKKKKFVGYQKSDNKKQLPQIIFYFFDYQERHESAGLQYMIIDN